MPILNYKVKPEFWIEEAICRCDCLSSDHKLIFEKIMWRDEKTGEICFENISVYIGLGNDLAGSLWQRIKWACKHIFRYKRWNTYVSHDILFSKDNIDQLEEAIKWLKESENQRRVGENNT